MRRTAAGSWFQAVGPATENALGPPSMTSVVCRAVRWPQVRSSWQPSGTTASRQARIQIQHRASRRTACTWYVGAPEASEVPAVLNYNMVSCPQVQDRPSSRVKYSLQRAPTRSLADPRAPSCNSLLHSAQTTETIRFRTSMLSRRLNVRNRRRRRLRKHVEVTLAMCRTC